MSELKQFAIHPTFYVDVATEAEAEALAEYIKNLVASDRNSNSLFKALVDVEECYIEELEGDEDE
jgi:hypothetical protein